MTLVGRNYVGGYGQIQDDNFIRLLETGANPTEPSTPLIGQLWFNTTSNVLEVYNGTAFKAINGATAANAAPTNNSTGDLWYNTTGGQVSVWTGSTWLAIGPATPAGTGAAATTIVDSTSVTHEVIELTVSGNIVGIVSQDAVFTPANTIPGFANVKPGINLATTVNSGNVPTFVGTASNANTFAGLASSSFMRTDINTSTTGTLEVLNNTGLAVGTNNNFTATIASNANVNLQNNTLNGNIHVGVNLTGTNFDAITVDGVAGNVKIASNLIVQGNIISAAGNVVGNTFNTTAWQITEISGNLFFQLRGSGANIAKLDTSGNFTTIGNIVPNSSL
jgi:hypothetical protein